MSKEDPYEMATWKIIARYPLLDVRHLAVDRKILADALYGELIAQDFMGPLLELVLELSPKIMADKVNEKPYREIANVLAELIDLERLQKAVSSI